MNTVRPSTGRLCVNREYSARALPFHDKYGIILFSLIQFVWRNVRQICCGYCLVSHRCATVDDGARGKVKHLRAALDRLAAIRYRWRWKRKAPKTSENRRSRAPRRDRLKRAMRARTERVDWLAFGADTFEPNAIELPVQSKRTNEANK